MGQVTSITEGALGSIQVQRGADGQVLQSRRQLPLATNPSGANAARTFDGASQVEGFTYDPLGRLTADGRRTYTWDLAGRLASYAESGATAKFEYDAFVRRTARIQGATTNSYVWNYGYRMSAISIEQFNGIDRRFYVHTPDGLLLYSIDVATGARTHYHFDEAGNTVFLTDDQQNVVAAYAYGPYGESLGTSGNSDNLFTFQGRFGVMKEGASGLYYMQARYFDSDSVHFLSRDPLPLISPDAVNPYQYAFGNPVLYTDPTGLAPSTLTPTPTPAPAATPPPPVHVVTDAEFRGEIRRMKNQLWDRVSRSRAGALDISIPASFDSRYFKLYVNNMFSWRGRVMNGGELNYYFQGMYWKEASGSRAVMYSAIYGWKRFAQLKLGYGNGLPSANDMFAANAGFDETNSFGEELREDVCTIVEGLVGAPSGSISGFFGASSSIPSVSTYPTPGGFIPGF
jgi:RHS repeat-associated protein